jgi:DNA-binding helix-hairpin-helix protein with protein kinase domain
VATLERLDERLVTCGDDPRHAHPRADGCPWCRIEIDGGPSFFFLPPGAAPDAFDAAATWRSIEAVDSPGPAALPPAPPLAVAGLEGLATAALRALRGLLGDVALRSSAYLRAESEREGQAIATCEANLRRVETQWQELCGEAHFVAKRKQLAEARAALDGLKALEESEWEEVTSRYREQRLKPYLESFALEFARIPGLGPAELARLEARGIRTAAGVTPEALMALRGIDLGLVKALLLYKGVATRAFRFDPVIGIPGRERKALADRQARRRAELVKALQSGALELAEIRRQTLAWRDVLSRALDEQRRRLGDLRAHAVWTWPEAAAAAALARPASPRGSAAGASAGSAGRSARSAAR